MPGYETIMIDFCYYFHFPQAFSFLSLFLFIGMLVYFFAARYALRWPSHGEKAPNKGYEQTDDLVDE